jgi:pilus assembly protein CpaF
VSAFDLVVIHPGGRADTFPVPAAGTMTLGSGGGCSAQVVHPLMPTLAAEVAATGGGVEVRPPAGDPAALAPGETAAVGSFSLRLVARRADAPDPAGAFHDRVRDIHARALEAIRVSDFATAPGPDVVAQVEAATAAAAEAVRVWADAGLTTYAAGLGIKLGAGDRLIGAAGVEWRRLARAVPAWEQLADRLTAGAPAGPPDAGLADRLDALAAGFDGWWAGQAAALSPDDLKYLANRLLARAVKDLLFGYGPLEDLLRADAVTEIMVVPPGRVYVEIGGVLLDTGRRFPSDDAVRKLIDRIVAQVQKHASQSNPLVDARLTSGHRVHAAVPPVAVGGSILTVRKFPTHRMTLDDLVARRALTRGAAAYLRTAVRVKRNIVVSGGTGTGKTTFVNALTDAIPPAERVLTAEDTAELRPGCPHVVRLEAREANAEKAGAVTMQDLNRNALRMRPDRIIVGEVRGKEALDMLKAMNTGHEGSMTTVHANDPWDAVTRVTALALEAGGDLPAQAIRDQIGSAVHVILQLRRFPDGRRRVSEIVEVAGVDARGAVRLRSLYASDPDAGGRLRPTGRVSVISRELAAAGLTPAAMFDGSES